MVKKYVLLGLLSFACGAYASLGTEISYGRAIQSAQKGDLPKAQKELAQLLVDNHDRPDLLYDAGVVAFKQKEFEKAQAYFLHTARNPNADEALKQQAYFNAGNASVELKQLEDALVQYEQVLARNDEHEYAKNNYARVKEMLEQQKQQEKNKDDSKDQQQEKNEGDQPQDKKDQQQDDKGAQDQGKKDEPKKDGKQDQSKDGKQDQNKKGKSDTSKDQKDQQGSEQPSENTDGGKKPDEKKDGKKDGQKKDEKAGDSGDHKRDEKRDEKQQQDNKQGQPDKKLDKKSEQEQAQNKNHDEQEHKPSPLNKRSSDDAQKDTPDTQQKEQSASNVSQKPLQAQPVEAKDITKKLDKKDQWMVNVLNAQEQVDKKASKQIIKGTIDKELAGQRGQNCW